MAFKSPIWFPIAVLLSIGNVIAVWFAAVPAEPLHATVHAALGVGFASWAHRLRQAGRARQIAPETVAALDALEASEAELSTLRRELSEAQQRLDFAERVLVREPAPQRREPSA